jgi:transposase
LIQARRREAILDGAFTAARCQEWSNRHGMRHCVVERDPAQTGFVVLAGRWVVERSFGWLVHWGGLLRDRAGRLDVSAARVACAAILSGVEALLNPMPVPGLTHEAYLSLRSVNNLL